MGIFDLVRRNFAVQNFNFVHFLETKSPVTPKCEDVIINMETLDLDVLRDGIIWNLYHQGLPLKTETLRILIKFLESDFINITETIPLQVLLHYTKMDITKIYCSYSTNFDKSGVMPSKKLSVDDYFDGMIANFVRAALEQRKTTCDIEEISEEMKDLIYKALLTDAVLLAFQVCLNDVLTTDYKFDDISLDWLKSQISTMKIYVVKNFLPLKRLRGACLIDGILLCISELAQGAKVNKADMITIAIHECCHYLARCKCKNFNFSSPFSYLPSGCQKRADLALLENNLEMGRCIELLLFDGIQPHWSFSSDKAAERFLDLLWTSSKYPILAESQHESLGLMSRIPPSSSFGIDVDEDEFHVFC